MLFISRWQKSTVHSPRHRVWLYLSISALCMYVHARDILKFKTNIKWLVMAHDRLNRTASLHTVVLILRVSEPPFFQKHIPQFGVLLMALERSNNSHKCLTEIRSCGYQWFTSFSYSSNHSLTLGASGTGSLFLHSPLTCHQSICKVCTDQSKWASWI